MFTKIFFLKAPRCYKMMSLLKIFSGFCNFCARATMEVRPSLSLFQMHVFIGNTRVCLHKFSLLHRFYKKASRRWEYLFIFQISRIFWEPKLETQPQSTSLSALWTICSVFRWLKHKTEGWIHLYCVCLTCFSLWFSFRNLSVTSTGTTLAKK